MTREQLNQYVSSLSDSVLLERLDEAADDLKSASNNQNNSEWHEACFAAVITYGEEAARRGLKIQP